MVISEDQAARMAAQVMARLRGQDSLVDEPERQDAFEAEILTEACRDGCGDPEQDALSFTFLLERAGLLKVAREIATAQVERLLSRG